MQQEEKYFTTYNNFELTVKIKMIDLFPPLFVHVGRKIVVIGNLYSFFEDKATVRGRLLTWNRKLRINNTLNNPLNINNLRTSIDGFCREVSIKESCIGEEHSV